MEHHDEAGSAPEHHAPTFELNPADWTTADEIRRRSFSTAEQGFDPQEVRDYLAKLADWFADLNVQLSRLRKSQQSYGPDAAAAAAAGAPQPPAPTTEAAPAEVGGLAARMADVLREAEEHASRVRADAELRAEQLLAQSREEAERVRSESGGAIQRARVEAEERLRRANETRDALLSEIRRLRDHLAELTSRLESVATTEQPPATSEAPRRPVHPADRGSGPAVVLPDVVAGEPSEPVVVNGAPPAAVPQPRAQAVVEPERPTRTGPAAEAVRGPEGAGEVDLWSDDGDAQPQGPVALDASPTPSNVRQLPGIEARTGRDPGGDHLPTA